MWIYLKYEWECDNLFATEVSLKSVCLWTNQCTGGRLAQQCIGKCGQIVKRPGVDQPTNYWSACCPFFNVWFCYSSCFNSNILIFDSWCLLIVFNCNEKAGNLNVYSFLASTFALKAVSSTDRNPRRRSTRLMTWQNFHFLLSLLKAKRFCWEPPSSFLPQAPPSWYKTTLNLPAGLH